MTKEIHLSAPDLPEEEAVRVLARFLAWRKDRIRDSRAAKSLFRLYSFGVREYKNNIIIKIKRKPREEAEK